MALNDVQNVTIGMRDFLYGLQSAINDNLFEFCCCCCLNSKKLIKCAHYLMISCAGGWEVLVVS